MATENKSDWFTLGPTKKDINNWFSYHTPNGKQVQQYYDLRAAGKELALQIQRTCPTCADTTAAIRKVREAVMTANAAIACAPTDPASPQGDQAAS